MGRRLKRGLAIALSVSTAMFCVPVYAAVAGEGDEAPAAQEFIVTTGDDSSAQTGQNTGDDSGASTDQNSGDDSGAPTDQNTGDDSGAPTDQNTGDDSGAPTDQNTGDDSGAPADQNTGDDSGAPTDQNDEVDPSANDGYFNIVSGTYNCRFFDGNTRTFYYSDDYFAEKGSVTNPHLRTLSAALAISTFGQRKNPDEYALDMVQQMGFEDVTTYGKASGDIISVTMGHKNVNGNELVAMAVGVADEGAGWGSNFNVGKSGDHAGFAEAAKLVGGYFDKYKSEYSVAPKKVWASGYSRGGAAAELFGKYLNQNAGTIGISPDDIYIYTFEAPKTTTDDTSFPNIHNCVDENDFVPYVAPANWGFTNCGVKEVMNLQNKKLKKKQLDFFKLLGGESKVSKNDGTSTYAAFNADFINWLTGDKYVTREEYVEKLQDSAISLGNILGGKTDKERQRYSDYFEKDFTDSLKKDENKYVMLSAMGKVTSSDSEKQKLGLDQFKEMLYSIIDEDAAKKVFTSEELDVMKKVISNATEPLFHPLLDDFMASEDRGDDSALYSKVKKDHSSDSANNEIDKVVSTDGEKDDWYAGYDVGYDNGYEDGTDKVDYNSAPKDLPEKLGSKKIAESGYLFGYYEGYLRAVDFGKIDHVLQKTMTMAENAEKIVEMHEPETNIKVVEALDSYYTDPPLVGVPNPEGSSYTASIFAGTSPLRVIVIILAIVIAVETAILISRRRATK